MLVLLGQSHFPGIVRVLTENGDCHFDETARFVVAANDPTEIVRMQMARPASNPKLQYDAFYMSDPMKSLADHAADGKLTYQGLQTIEWSGPDVELLLRFQLSFADDGVQRQMPFAVRMKRSRYEGGEYHWMVDEVLRVARSE